jgi:sugar phosphate isomerase/epimerase
MKISMGSWVFSFGPFADDPVPFDRTVERLAKAKLDGIEVCGFPPHVTVDRYPTPESRSELAQFITDHGLGVSGYAADFTFVNPVTPGNRQKYLDLFSQNLELAVAIGSPTIRVDSGAAPGSIEDRDYTAAMDRLAAIWNEAAGIAQKANVRVCWEFEPGFAFNKPSEIRRLHGLVDHPNFWILFDSAHAHMCSVVGSRQHGTKETLAGGVTELVDLLKGRIGAVHLIDSDGTLYAEETSRHRPFGRGVIDFQPLADRLLEIKGIEWWCIDTCFCTDAWELVESSRDFVAGLLKRAPVLKTL